MLYYDPAPIYKNIHTSLNPYSRHNTFKTIDAFPNKEDKSCACGCGKAIPSRSSRYHHPSHREIISGVFLIISGNVQSISAYMEIYYNRCCASCGKTFGWDLACEIDHIIGVKHGGGGSWLSNYQPMCKKCHREKTNADFGFKQEVEKIITENDDIQMKLF